MNCKPIVVKKLSIITPCYNEEENVEELHLRIRDIASKLLNYDYEHIYIDNASTDRTPAILRKIAAADPKVKVILNARNFGAIRSQYYGLLQATGDAVAVLASDFQDPPELIPTLVAKWEEGFKAVVGVKNESEESPLFFFFRRCYYKLVHRLAETETIQNYTGFGLYDKVVIDICRKLDDPYPFFRGLISEIGLPTAIVPYFQPSRKRGITKNNFYTLYDIAMLGITNHSKVPLRIATMLGFAMAFLSLLTAIGYLVYKLLFWDRFTLGMAPVVIGLFLFSSVQLFFIGILGEYIGAIHTQVLNRPLVVEKERINF
ncbi:MAG: dolichol monophosphate mannose synthase [Verrucomicrobiales bacterium]|nr:dolichol monophosphate mannose synthase [Verrucomicrobiales bacterium]